jgi:hypothetical protein
MYPPVHMRRRSAHGTSNKRGLCIVLMDRHVMEVVCRRMVMVVYDLRPRRKPRRARARVLETWRGPERAAHPDPLTTLWVWTVERAACASARPSPRIHKEELSVGLRVTWNLCLWATLCDNAMGGLGELERMAATACASTGTRRSNNVVAIATSGPTKPCW